jgi:hypothetical protein
VKELLRTCLADAKIALAWRYGWKKNRDGQLVLGKCRKVSDLDKQFQGHDFVIVLNSEAWYVLTEEQREALMFHELCHAAIAVDQNGNPKKDARDRQVYRIKKHDIEEFGDVIAKFGCYKQDLENFVATAMRSKKPPAPTLLDGIEDDKTDGKEEAAVAEPETEHAGGHVEKVRSERKRPVPKKHQGKGSGKGKERSR